MLLPDYFYSSCRTGFKHTEYQLYLRWLERHVKAPARYIWIGVSIVIIARSSR